MSLLGSSQETNSKNLGIIRKGLETKSENILMSHKFMACPKLEFSVQFWLPHGKKSMLKWDKVQKRVTKMIKRLS